MVILTERKYYKPNTRPALVALWANTLADARGA